MEKKGMKRRVKSLWDFIILCLQDILHCSLPKTFNVHNQHELAACFFLTLQSFVLKGNKLFTISSVLKVSKSFLNYLTPRVLVGVWVLFILSGRLQLNIHEVYTKIMSPWSTVRDDKKVQQRGDEVHCKVVHVLGFCLFQPLPFPFPLLSPFLFYVELAVISKLALRGSNSHPVQVISPDNNHYIRLAETTNRWLITLSPQWSLW